MIEPARAAVEAATSAGASDAEAYAVEDAGREVRVHGGEVESLTAATRRGVGLRAWIGRQVGFAYGTDLSANGIGALAERAVEAARVSDEDEFAGPATRPENGAAAISGLSDPAIAEWSTAQLAELGLGIERAALAADPRIAAVEQAVYADSAESVAIVPITPSPSAMITSSP